MTISVDDFPAFFEALHNDPETPQEKRKSPFPWQRDLMKVVAAEGWPDVLDLPTGFGKTAAIDIAAFHLVLDAQHRRAPRRIFFIVDRRVVVDAAFARAQTIAQKLGAAEGGILKRAREALLKYGGSSPLRAAVLRGGMYRDDGWATSPVQPVVCVSTVDQVGSRLLFRGYGVSGSMQPIHAALVGCDSLILLDEAHLSDPFVQTLKLLHAMRRHTPPDGPAAFRGLRLVTMTATPRDAEDRKVFRIAPDDRANRGHAVLNPRLTARKLARLEEAKTKAPAKTASREEQRDAEIRNRQALVERAVDWALLLAGRSPRFDKKLRADVALADAPPAKIVAVVVNRVATAREIFEQLRELKDDHEEPLGHTILLTGRTRTFDRDELLYRCDAHGQQGWLPYMEANRDRPTLDRLLFVVATQTIEAGADLDFDALVTEAASLDALRQRFGRLDRLGYRRISHAVILASSANLKVAADPVYGSALSATWERLDKWGGKGRVVDFGIAAMEERIEAIETELPALLAPRREAPELLPAHVDTLCQTNPAPLPDLEISLFLHGPEARPGDVQLVWRADLLEMQDDQQAIETVSLIPPSSPEALPVSLADIRRWLEEQDWTDDLTDLEGAPQTEQDSTTPRSAPRVLRWCGPDDERTQLVDARSIRPGDTIIVPADWGGYDRFGWNPQSRAPVQDIAERAQLQVRHRPALRLHAALLNRWRGVAGAAENQEAIEIPNCVTPSADEQGLPRPSREDLEVLRDSNQTPSWLARMMVTWLDNDPSSSPFRTHEMIRDQSGRQTGWLLEGRKRWAWEQVKEVLGETTSSATAEITTEDDASSFIAEPVPLQDHCGAVRACVCAFAEALDLPKDLCDALATAAELHDAGKADYRFQLWLHGGSERAEAESETLLAKSQRPLRGLAAHRARERSGWPAITRDGKTRVARHEGISVRLAEALLRERPEALPEMIDRDLLLYLVGTHHGHGRPFFGPIPDPHPETVVLKYNRIEDRPFVRITDSPGPGETVTASSDHRLHHLASGWADRFWRLVHRYDPWTLALLEAVLRLADHDASAAAAEGENAR